MECNLHGKELVNSEIIVVKDILTGHWQHNTDILGTVLIGTILYFTKLCQ